MSNQSFTVYVTNKTGDTITNVSAIHYCDGVTIGNTWSSITDGTQQQLGTVQTYTAHKDYWVIQFAYDGNLYQANCYCSPDSGDTSGNIVLTANYYSIVYSPIGDSCANKPYSYTTA
ncbi:MAG TPA: hypothetical protein VN253_04180 [Kofleriaceae bacterium]|nr:hypothetical protein [Kofleriaceae bacterium]